MSTVDMILLWLEPLVQLQVVDKLDVSRNLLSMNRLLAPRIMSALRPRSLCNVVLVHSEYLNSELSMLEWS